MHSMQHKNRQASFPEIVIITIISGGGILSVAEAMVKQEMRGDLIAEEVSDINSYKYIR